LFNHKTRGKAEPSKLRATFLGTWCPGKQVAQSGGKQPTPASSKLARVGTESNEKLVAGIKRSFESDEEDDDDDDDDLDDDDDGDDDDDDDDDDHDDDDHDEEEGDDDDDDLLPPAKKKPFISEGMSAPF